MSWLFKRNKNETGEGTPKWEDITIISPVNWVLAICLVILFIILFFIGFPFIIVIPFIAIFYTTFSCLAYKGTFNNKSITSFSLIKEVFKQYKVGIATLLSLFVVLLTFSKLGNIAGIFSLITLGLIYWEKLPIDIDLFKPILETNVSPSVSYEQAKKSCSVKSKLMDKHGLLYNLIFGQKGGNITKELKKISKKLETL